MSAARRWARRGLATLAVVALGASLSGCGIVNRIRQLERGGSGDGSSAAPGDPIIDMSVGDCFDDDDSDDADGTTGVPTDCAAKHDDEVFALPAIDASALPSDLRLDKLGQTECMAAFQGYVGVDYADSTLQYGYSLPDDADWKHGRHRLACYLYDWNQDQLSGSMKGTGT